MGRVVMKARIALASVIVIAALGLAVPSAGASVTLTPASADFGSLNVGTTSVPQAFTLTNTCDAPSGINPNMCISVNAVSSAVSTTGDFGQTNDCPATLFTFNYPSSTSCTINVTFAPTTAGSLAGTLSAGGMSRPLSGTGVALPIQSTVQSTAEPTGERAAALKKCKKKRTKAARKRCRKNAQLLPV